MGMIREVNFKFSIPGPVGASTTPIFATEFDVQSYNRDHRLTPNAPVVGAGNFQLTFLTDGNVDEVIKKVTVESSSIDSTAGAAAGWTLDFPMATVYWAYESQNDGNYNYRMTFPFTVRNNAAAPADIPAGGADLKMKIKINLV
jgi:hypothetical protein